MNGLKRTYSLTSCNIYTEVEEKVNRTSQLDTIDIESESEIKRAELDYVVETCDRAMERISTIMTLPPKQRTRKIVMLKAREKIENRIPQTISENMKLGISIEDEPTDTEVNTEPESNKRKREVNTKPESNKRKRGRPKKKRLSKKQRTNIVQ